MNEFQKDPAGEVMVDVFTCADVVEKTVVQDALSEAGIHFLFRAGGNVDNLGILDGEHGEGVVAVLEEDAERAIAVIQDALPGETEVENIEEEDA